MSIAIKVENLSKAYQLGQIGTGTVSKDIERWWVTKVRGKEDPFLKIGETNITSIKGTSNIVWSLKDINFEIEQGDTVGIIGRNGAGKSTLLKVLSEITSPTTGRINIKGRVASLLEVGTGFHPELSGRENIFLNGAILGMRKKEIEKKLDDIIDFSGVERYIDTPVKRYSSGMYVRLAFAVAAYLEPEILIVDEVLAVGDAEFQKRALGKMQDVSQNEGRTVLFVSHNMGSIQTLCKSGILLENGRIISSGEMLTVVNSYLASQQDDGFYSIKKRRDSAIYISSISVNDVYGVAKKNFLHTDKIRISTQLVINIPTPDVMLLIVFLDKYKREVFCAETKINNQDSFVLEIASKFLTRGTYSLQVYVYKSPVTEFEFLDDVCTFEVVDAGSEFAHMESFNYGSVFGRFEWI
jgi:lipopolysaccharide transport system ATP-binding protein